jgi:simple sugar transport system ATP-binding protein
VNVTLQNVSKTFGTLRANDSISVSFAAGHIHGIVGENGAGKSTLMKILSGFLQRDTGEIMLGETAVELGSPATALTAGIGMVYQEPLDIPAFTVLENFYCASPRAALPNITVARETLLSLAKKLGFSLDPRTPINKLTVGQRQQLEMVRLLACGSQVLILDEPTTGITAAQKNSLFAALRHLATEGKTILFVSHKLEEIADLCHTVTVLRAGQVMGDGQLTIPQSQDHLLQLMFGQDPHTPDISPADPQAFIPSLPHPVWRLEEIEIRTGSLEISNLTLDVRAGMILGLAGLDGSGQQLLLRILAGMIPPNAGHVLLNGIDYTHSPLSIFQEDGIHFLPADRLAEGLIGPFSLTDHIALNSVTSWLLPRREELRAKAQQAIEDYDIKATPETPIDEFSGGNQQRAMLSLLPPRCTGLVLEHPTRGLDVSSAEGIWQRLQARCADGTAIVFSSPDLDELLTYSDEVVVFFGGQATRPIRRSALNVAMLAELIGGVGFDAYASKQ